MCMLRKEEKQPSTNTGVLFGSLAIFVSVLGASLTFPFLQAQRDKLGCDALCYGSMQSTRSGLSMIGTVLVGRMSDRLGRSTALWIGIGSSMLSYMIYLNGDTITAMWLGLIPAALLNQNFSVLKALFADYSTEYGLSESERASAIGRLGMAVGLSFMVGPLLGANLLSDYQEATIAAMVACFVSAIFLSMLPIPNVERKVLKDSGKTSVEEKPKNSITSAFSAVYDTITGFIYMPTLKLPGARLLLFMRCCMALAFSIFMTVWTVSLKSRFEFGPKDHAYFMGWIGLCYALSQGVLARELIKLSKDNPTNLLLTCVLTLSFGRVFAMMTSSLVIVYFLMALVIVALGVMNTSMASACTHLAGHDQVGGLFGVMEAMESLAGFFGPTLGGVLHRLDPNLPIVSVVLVYSLVFGAVWFYYHVHVVLHGDVVDMGVKEIAGENEKKNEKKESTVACKEVDNDSTELTDSEEKSENDEALNEGNNENTKSPKNEKIMEKDDKNLKNTAVSFSHLRNFSEAIYGYFRPKND